MKTPRLKVLFCLLSAILAEDSPAFFDAGQKAKNLEFSIQHPEFRRKQISCPKMGYAFYILNSEYRLSIQKK
jgi:hypothetical protein